MEKLKKKIEIISSLYKARKLTKAESLCKNLINNYPNIVFLYNLLGLILTDQRKIEEAIECYEKGIKINPKYAMIYNNLGAIYKYKNKYKEAENYYKKSIKLDNKIPEPHNNLGNLYTAHNKYKEGIISYNNAVNLKPDFFIAHYNLGITYKTLGKIKESKKHFKECIKINPNLYTAHRNLGLITKYQNEDEHFKILKLLHNDNKIEDSKKSELSFALGKANEDIKDFKSSFKYYSEGNKLRRKQISFSIDLEKKVFKNIKKTFNQKLFEKNKKITNSDSTAIFIIGMPRSGTTLVEQILSSHPKVYGGDELFFLQNICKKHLFINSTSNFLDVKPIDKVNFEKMGDEYISNIKNISNKSERVTDKLPINFKLIGLIKLILPKSKIIHCVRNPKDNCFSIFKNYFVNPELNFAYDLKEIVEYYKLYYDLMSYWKIVLPNFIFDINYESIINNTENQNKNINNLPWNEKCLKFYENNRAIKTASDTQARNKIYKTSINSWKKFEEDLKSHFVDLPN